MNILIVILSSIFFRCSGWGENDPFCPLIPIKMPQNRLLQLIIGRLREIGIGGLIWTITGQFWVFLAYLIATSIPYGDNKDNWLRKLVGRDINWLIYGFCFGACSFLVLSPGLSLIESLLGAISFHLLMTLSNDGQTFYRHKLPPNIWKLDHSYVELGFGFLGTLMYIFR